MLGLRRPQRCGASIGSSMVRYTGLVVGFVAVAVSCGTATEQTPSDSEPVPATTLIENATPAPGPMWPGARQSHGMVADGDGHLIVFGGRTVANGTRVYLSDTWRYDTRIGAWSAVDTGSALPPRAQYAFTAVDSADAVLLFGGYVGDRFTYPGTWTFDGATWIRVETNGAPTPRAGAAATFDEESGVIVMFGGAEEPTVPELPTNDTWIFDPAASTWTERFPTVSPRPKTEGHPVLFELALVYDTESDRSILLIGGDETWAYDANSNTWEERAAPGLEADFMVAAAYDARLDRLVTYGGGPTDVSDETWLYDYNKDTWQRIETPTSPGEVGNHAMAYDPVTQLTYLFGGGGDLLPLDGVGDVSAELWAFDGEDWTRLGP